jgi:glycosyltransferase involved in cell wall biosynthesis
VKAAVYNRFWHSQGGGERHSGMVAQVLSHDGVEVDLIGHTQVDKDELADHLGLDLSRCTLRIVPDKGDLEMSAVSQDYDLFVNGSYMSRLAPRSAKAAYLCYFPTPFYDFPEAWRRLAVKYVGPLVRAHAGGLEYGVGWFPPEGGRRRKWAWTSGDAVISLPPGGPRTLRMEVGGPGLAGTTALRVEDEHGTQLGEIAVSADFRVRRVRLPDAPRGAELHFRSDTFVPGGTDHRTLGVAVSKLRLEAGRYGPRELLAYRYPWLLHDSQDLSFLEHYDTVMANSEYTRGWIQRSWHTDSDVLYPPIQVHRLHPAPVRQQAVLTVGRFFAPGLGHAKRQLDMVQFFGQAHRAGKLPGWTFYVVGGCEPSQEPYLQQVRDAAQGLPVEIIPNAPRARVEELLSSCSVFWSATGYGEDEEKKPWVNEHFGMTTVEAMAGGCVPVVIDRAGQKEIVRDGVDGFRWTTAEQLIERTVEVAEDSALRSRLAASAVARAHLYDEPAFADRWHAIVDQHKLLG